MSSHNLWSIEKNIFVQQTQGHPSVPWIHKWATRQGRWLYAGQIDNLRPRLRKPPLWKICVWLVLTYMKQVMNVWFNTKRYSLSSWQNLCTSYFQIILSKTLGLILSWKMKYMILFFMYICLLDLKSLCNKWILFLMYIEMRRLPKCGLYHYQGFESCHNLSITILSMHQEILNQWFLVVPSHYQNQCWLIITSVLHHLHDGNSIANTQESSHNNVSKITHLKWKPYPQGAMS